MDNKKAIESQIESILDDVIKQVQDLADEYREKVLIPLARKHHLTYVAGMGRTVFYKRDPQLMRRYKETSIASGDDAILEEAPYLVDVFDVLNLEVIGRNDVFGYYIRDITEADWKK